MRKRERERKWDREKEKNVNNLKKDGLAMARPKVLVAAPPLAAGDGEVDHCQPTSQGPIFPFWSIGVMGHRGGLANPI